MTHKTKTYSINFPFNGEAYTNRQLSELMERMVETYLEFAHVNYSPSEQEMTEVEYFTDTRTQGVRIYNDYGDYYCGVAHDMLDAFSKYDTREQAELMMPIVRQQKYELQRKMSTPIKRVEARVIEDSDGKFKIVTECKYDTF